MTRTIRVTVEAVLDEMPEVDRAALAEIEGTKTEDIPTLANADASELAELFADSEQVMNENMGGTNVYAEFKSVRVVSFEEVKT